MVKIPRETLIDTGAGPRLSWRAVQTTLKIASAVAALVLAWQVGQVDPPARRASADSGSPSRTPPPALPTGQYRGMAIQLHGGADVYDHYHHLIPEVAALGADTVLFVVHGWQEHGGSLDLHIDARRTAGAEALGRLCDLATKHGLRTILMPIVLLERARNSEWRGKIIPEGHDWDTWFKRYTRFIVHFARIAEKHKVAMLMVGSELIKTEGYVERWERVIEEVRQNYRGALGYSANWDHYQTSKIGFWPKLDFVGMTTYYELAAGPNPNIAEVDSNWVKIKDEIRAFQREVNKPILFTEIGWCSQEGAAHEGWNYYASEKATEAGHREQAMLYESFIKAWSDEPGIGGFIWWEWDTSQGGKNDYNYTPRGKPAEQILRQWFAEKKALQVADKPNGAARAGG